MLTFHHFSVHSKYIHKNAHSNADNGTYAMYNDVTVTKCGTTHYRAFYKTIERNEQAKPTKIVLCDEVRPAPYIVVDDKDYYSDDDDSDDDNGIYTFGPDVNEKGFSLKVPPSILQSLKMAKQTPAPIVPIHNNNNNDSEAPIKKSKYLTPPTTPSYTTRSVTRSTSVPHLDYNYTNINKQGNKIFVSLNRL